MADFALSEDLKQLYDNCYEGTSAWRVLSARGKASSIVGLCSGYPHHTILDIGAGEGAVLKRLSDLGFGERLFALEISTSGVEAIRQAGIGALADAALFDGYTIPYAGGRFDLAILSHVIEHVEYPRRLLYEAGRVAQYIYIEVPLEDTVKLARDYVPNALGHINVYSPKTIRHLAQTCGLEVIQQTVTNLTPEVYEYLWGKKGLLKHRAREIALRAAPNIATRLWTYHSSLLCRSLQHQ